MSKRPKKTVLKTHIETPHYVFISQMDFNLLNNHNDNTYYYVYEDKPPISELLDMYMKNKNKSIRKGAKEALEKYYGVERLSVF